jgi:hypothetical protein
MSTRKYFTELGGGTEGFGQDFRAADQTHGVGHVQLQTRFAFDDTTEVEGVLLADVDVFYVDSFLFHSAAEGQGCRFESLPSSAGLKQVVDDVVMVETGELVMRALGGKAEVLEPEGFEPYVRAIEQFGQFGKDLFRDFVHELFEDSQGGGFVY